MAKRILLAGLFHETNTFAPGTMGLDQFVIKTGEGIFELKGNGSPIGAFLEEAERYEWEVIPTVDVRGTPGALPAEEVYDYFLREFEFRMKTDVDAIFLVLHGAMVSPGLQDVEGNLLARIRAISTFEKTPIFGVLDLHGNITPEMAALSNGLIAYRKNPHTDAAETAVVAARLLQKTLESGAKVATRFVPTSLLWPPPGTATAAKPMATLEAIAREEERDGVLAVNIFAGFSHADIYHTGVSFTIVYNEGEVSEERLAQIEARLRDAAEAEKELGLPFEWDLDEAIQDALQKGAFPCCLVEPADNVGGGACADGTSILRALLKHQVAGGVILYDPESVAALKGAEPGSVHSLKIGGKTFPGDPGPVPVTARLVRLTDGSYTLEDRHSHAASMSGVKMWMGDCAVIEVDKVTVLLTSRRSAPMDLGQWRSQGVEPSELKFIGVKAAVAHRQAYDPITKASYWVRTPGPCATDLKSLPFQNVRRPVFPLDTDLK